MSCVNLCLYSKSFNTVVLVISGIAFKRFIKLKPCIMKTIISIGCFLLVLFSCKKVDEEKNDILSFVKTEKGGCFDRKYVAATYFPDTVSFAVNTDTLTMHLGLSYNCCSKLSDSIKVTNNVITAFISDTCSSMCDCKCLCYFTYDFKFEHYTPKTLIYIVKLKPYNQNNYSIIMQDTIQ